MQGVKLTITAAGVGLAVLLLVGMAAYQNTLRFINTGEWVEHTHEVLHTLQRLHSRLLDAETGQRGFILTGDERYLDPYQNAVSHVHENLAALSRLTADNPRQRRRLAGIPPLVEAKLSELEQTIRLRRDSGFGAARALVASDVGKHLMDDLRALIHVVETEEQGLLKERAAAFRRTGDRTISTVSVGSALGAALLLVATSLLLMEVARRRRSEEALAEHRDRLEDIVADRTSDLKRSEGRFRRIAERVPEVFSRVDRAGRYQFVNSKFEEWFGISSDDVLGKHCSEVLGEEAYKLMKSHIQAALSGDRQSFEAEIPFQYVGLRWVNVEYVPEHDEDGIVNGFYALVMDVTERKRAEAAEVRSLRNEALIASMLRIAQKPGHLTDTLREILPLVLTKRGLSIEEKGCIFVVEGEPKTLVLKASHNLPDALLETCATIPFGRCLCGRAAEIGQPIHESAVTDSHSIRYEGMKPHGHCCAPIKGGDEVIGVLNLYVPAGYQLSEDDNRFIGMVTDTLAGVIQRKQGEERLQLAANVFSHASEGITITDADGTIIEVNDAFTQITGYSREEAVGRNPREYKSDLQGPEFYAAMWRDLVEQGHWSGEVWNRRKDGELYASMLTISAVRDAENKTQQYVALYSDITAQKLHEEQLKHIAYHDVLTDLPNRTLLADRLRQAMILAQRRGQPLAVGYLDLDGFKKINDAHGHSIGDQFLTRVAARLKQVLREGDTIARFGGDEFVMVLVDLPDNKTRELVTARVLEAVAEPVKINDRVLQVSASLGLTIYPQTDNVDPDHLIRQADQAMYQAKLGGTNRWHIFDADHDRSIRGRHENLDRIRLALTEREFLLYYQPKVNMRTGELVGAEALVRWQHPERGLLPPAEFLPLIEFHDLAVDLGYWVLETALAQLEAWQSAGLDISVSVNVGAKQLQQAGFVGRLGKLLAAHPNVRPGDLELEVIETSALEDLAQASDAMRRCRELGVKLALDDFGTGYSSLTYFKHLPADQLKIDQSFVRDVFDVPDDLIILEGVLGMATAFGREVIAEGVETMDHGRLLLQLGCELGQGYGIARPMPAHELPSWAGSWRPDPAWRDQPAVSHNHLPPLYAGIEHRAWVRAIESCVRGERATPPPLDRRGCRFGRWMEREGHNGHNGYPAFTAIDQLHRQVHALAVDLIELRDKGRQEEALGRLGELHGLRDALLEKLENLPRDTGS